MSVLDNKRNQLINRILLTSNADLLDAINSILDAT